MMKKLSAFLVLTLTVLCSCLHTENSNIFEAIQDFDNSLDSLLPQEKSNETNHLILFGDTILGSPKSVSTKWYISDKKDSASLIPPNCHNYIIRNNKLILHQGYNWSGNSIYIKYLHFDSIINQELVNQTREEHPDTNYRSSLRLYDSKGRLIKSIIEYVSTQKLISRDLYVYEYKGDIIVNHRRSYYGKEYNIDSLKYIESESFHTFKQTKSKQWVFKYDEKGNWIEKHPETYDDFPDFIYRKINY